MTAFNNSEGGIYKREPTKRVFANRNLRLEKIQWFGFDMDYTLAMYKSPNFEILMFDGMVKRMVEIGYPEIFTTFNYDPIFPTRGLWFDYQYGNLLKVDEFGNILRAMHGLRWLNVNEIEEHYPNKFIALTEQKVYVLNTLFNLPETHLVAQVVDYFDNHSEFEQNPEKTGVRNGDLNMSYKSIFQDIRKAVDYMHCSGQMKDAVVDNFDTYVERDERIGKMLETLRANGKKTFLLTNSDYKYTNGLLTQLLGDDWTKYFDISIVDARKPYWFAEGSVFREVNTKTGALQIGVRKGPLIQEVVYSGGNCEAFRKLVKCRGRDVLYVGDHIFGDVLKSKKSRGWRTFLVVPELVNELNVWTQGKEFFENIKRLEQALAEAYKTCDVSTKDKPANSAVIDQLKQVTKDMDAEYGVFGSLFRLGSSQTFFASQVERYADIYASSCVNLLYYPSFYFFRSPMTLMSHEMTVDHGSTLHHYGAKGFYHQDTLGEKVRGWNRGKTLTKSTTFCQEDDDEGSPNSQLSSDHEIDGKKSRTSSVDEEFTVARDMAPQELTNTDVLSVQNEHIDHTSN
uniref:5'-nucleotidase domain-containing protein 4 n=1 Tax=Rhabditophanes sp. KR3021 TaxID=114890 RepID=A0AC35U5D4_9BILA